MTKKALKKQLKKQLKKAAKQAAKNKKAIKLLKKQLSAFEAKSMSYLERLFMSNVDYPIDDFGAIAYVDASYSDTGRFGSIGIIGIVMLTRSDVIQYSEIPENLEDCALTSTNHELLAAAKAIQMAKERHIKNLIIKHDNNSIAEVAKSHSVTKTSMEEWYKQLVMKHREKMSITFKKVKGHSKEYFNELADTLANKALKAERVKRANTPLFFSLGDKFQEALAKVKICC